jgi:hypothetical protein
MIQIILQPDWSFLAYFARPKPSLRAGGQLRNSMDRRPHVRRPDAQRSVIAFEMEHERSA